MLQKFFFLVKNTIKEESSEGGQKWGIWWYPMFKTEGMGWSRRVGPGGHCLSGLPVTFCYFGPQGQALYAQSKLAWIGIPCARQADQTCQLRTPSTNGPELVQRLRWRGLGSGDKVQKAACASHCTLPAALMHLLIAMHSYCEPGHGPVRGGSVWH